MYQLYINEDRYEIKVSKLSATFRGSIQEHEAKLNPDEVIKYNSYYWFSMSRIKLITMGRETKLKWLKTLEEKINRVEMIKI